MVLEFLGSGSFLGVPALALLLSPAAGPGGGESFAIEKVRAGFGVTAQENVTVVLRDGRIAAIGRDVAIPAGAERIDGSGLTLLPGFIDGFAEFGFAKPEERATAASGPSNEGVAQDYGSAAYAETAEASRRGLRPEMHARTLLVAADKEANDKLRLAGFTSTLTAPGDGFLPGQACLMEIAELPPRDAVVTEPGLLVLKFRGGGGRRHDGGDFGYPSTLMGALAHLRQAFLDAQRLRGWRDSWRRNPAGVPRPPDDSCLDALLAALDGQLRVAFLVDESNDLLRALAFAQEFRLKAVIVGGKQAWKVSEQLAEARVPVIASLNFPDAPERKNATIKKPAEKPADDKKGGNAPDGAAAAAPQVIAAAEVKPDAPNEAVAAPQTKPPPGPSAPPAPIEWEVADPVIAEPLELFEQRQHDWEDEVKNVERLLAAGVDVALTSRGSSGVADFFGDLRVAIEHGLDANAAIACLTTAPAALFGVEQELGTLRIGASADLLLVDGDLASKERAVRHVFVAGHHYLGPKKKPPETKEGAKAEGKKDDATALDLTGSWTVESKGGHAFKATLTLAQKDGKLTGKLTSEMGSADLSSGSLDGATFTITTAFQLQNRTFEFTLKGTATKELLTGTLDTPFGEPAEFEAKRNPGDQR